MRAAGRSVLIFVLLSSALCGQDPGGQAAKDAPRSHLKKEIEGWTVWVNPVLLEKDQAATESALDLLSRQLAEIRRVVPPRAAKRLQEVPLWFNPPYEGVRPRAEYHPDPGWLRAHHRDPAMARAIEFTNVSIFEKECRRMPMLALHELAHAYHHQVIGHDHQEIKRAYEAARASGTYESVKRWTGEKEVTDRAYALSNEKEYFAELTESFFGRNDFYPFDREQLEKHDPEMVRLLPRLWDRAETADPGPPAAAGGEEDRFDPPLEGSYLGLRVETSEGTVVVRAVDQGSPAELAGISIGDIVLRLGEASGLREGEEFNSALGELEAGRPVDLEVRTGEVARTLHLITAPAILDVHYRMVETLKASRYFREKDGSEKVIGAIEAEGPSLRSVRRRSEAHEILNRSLTRLGASHTAFIPAWSYQNLLAGEHQGEGGFWTGLILDRVGSCFFAAEILDASPAVRAGLILGDEVLQVNGIPLTDSPRRVLAGYESRRERYTIQVDEGETIEVVVRRTPAGPALRLLLTAAERVSGLGASSASVRWVERSGRAVAYLHLWNFLSGKATGLVRELVAPGRRHAEGLVIDLRGRGGQVAVVNSLARILKDAGRPTVLLIDGETRSAKEIFAHKMKGAPCTTLVGERTAGAVLPGATRWLPSLDVIMYPADPPNRRGWIAALFWTKEDDLLWGGLEGKGVEPDLPVRRAGLHAAGADPILEEGLRAVLRMLEGVPRRRRL